MEKDLQIEKCKYNTLIQCAIDVLNWFEKSPVHDNGGDNVQKCLTDNFQQKKGFLQSFNKKMEIQENRGKANIGQERVECRELDVDKIN